MLAIATWHGHAWSYHAMPLSQVQPAAHHTVIHTGAACSPSYHHSHRCSLQPIMLQRSSSIPTPQSASIWQPGGSGIRSSACHLAHLGNPSSCQIPHSSTPTVVATFKFTLDRHFVPITSSPLTSPCPHRALHSGAGHISADGDDGRLCWQ